MYKQTASEPLQVRTPFGIIDMPVDARVVELQRSASVLNEEIPIEPTESAEDVIDGLGSPYMQSDKQLRARIVRNSVTSLVLLPRRSRGDLRSPERGARSLW